MKQVFSHFSLRKLAVSSVGLLTLLGILSFAIYEVTKAEVMVKADDEKTSVYTHASTVGDVLEEQDIDMGRHDYVEPSADTAISEAMSIVYKEAYKVVINLEDEEQEVWTTVDTVGDLMDELKVEVKEHDVIEPPLERSITAEAEVNFESAFQVTLHLDGEENRVWTTSTTVADFLKEENVTLGNLDRVEPAEEEKILDEAAEINVVRVQKVTDVVEEKIDYATVTQKDSSLKQGSEKVKESGQVGKIEKHYEVVLEDGEEVSRELLKEEIIKDSKDRVVAVGTKAPTPTVSRASSSGDSGGSWQTFSATAYTAFCNGCSGVTYTGIDLRSNPGANVIAVDPRVIPLGSRVEVKGYGTFLAGDTGGAIKGRKIDIFIPDKGKVQAFGRKSVQIRVLD